MKQFSKLAIPALAFSMLVTGCSFGGSNNDKSKNEPSTLKVMYYDENGFFGDYGMVFSALYPNIEIEVVSSQSMYGQEVKDPEAEFEKFIEEKQPDILMLSPEQYSKQALDGKLYDLEARMTKEKYDTEGLVPGMLDYMREQGGGKVFGLSPTFNTQVLFYNKDLFEKYQVELPTSKMSWDQTIQLARLFPTDGEPKERIFGLKMGYSDGLFDIASVFANSENVGYVNASQKKMTINTDSWKSAFQKALDAQESNALYFESIHNAEGQNSQTYEDYLLSDPFVSGRSAMIISDNYIINRIKDASQNENVKDKVVKNWDMVTVPVGQQNPDQTSMMSFNNLFAIKADSPNVDAAWQFLSYVTSDDYARVKSRSHGYNGLPVRTKYITDVEGHNFAAFYELKPSSFNPYKDFDKLPNNFWGEFNGVAQEEMKKVKDKKQELNAALDILQVKGQEMLDREEPASTETPSTEEGSEVTTTTE